jgi:hypothetical protein
MHLLDAKVIDVLPWTLVANFEGPMQLLSQATHSKTVRAMNSRGR